MRFRGLDLNLLVVLDALFDLGSVTKAGERLSLSQSATSSALARLRDHFKDDLVTVRRNEFGIKEMVPTPFGLTLRDPVRLALRELQAMVDRQPAFDLATCDQHIRIIAPDYLEPLILAPAIRQARKDAPRMTFEVTSRASNESERDELRRGLTDFLIAGPQHLEEGHPSSPLIHDSTVCLGCGSNPRLHGRITWEEYLSLSRIDMNKFRRDKQKNYREREFGMIESSDSNICIDNMCMLPYYIIGTDLVAMAPKNLADYLRKLFNVKYSYIDGFDIPVDFRIQSHKMFDNDPIRNWLRDLILKTAKEEENRARKVQAEGLPA